MSQSITITVPLSDSNALNRAGDFFHKLAADAGGADAINDLAAERIRAAFAGEPAAESPAETETAAAPAPAPAPEAAAPAPEAAAPAPAPEAAAPGVELDSDGVPWDARIHSGSRAKLAKTKQWRPRRGVDKDLYRTVTAELKAAMAAPVVARTPAPAPDATTPVAPPPPAPAPAPVATTPVAPPPPAPDATAPVAPPPPAPDAAAPVASSGAAVRNFADLMIKINSHAKPQAEVLAAVQSVGLQSIPLLAARPDLIPQVDAILFPPIVA